MATVDSSLDYVQRSVSNGTHKYARLTPNTQNTLNVSAFSTSQVMTFDIPASRVYNFSKSYLSMTITVPGRADTTAGRFFHRWLAGTHSPIERISLQTRGKVFLCDLPFVGIFGKVALPIETEHSKYKTLPEPDTANPGDQTTLFSPSRSLANVFPAARSLAGGAGEAFTPGILAYESPSQEFGLVSTGASAAPLTFKYKLDLSLLKGTILALDKDIYMGDVLQLNVVFQQASKCVFQFNRDTGGVSTIVDTIGDYTITDLEMQLAAEIDPDINKALLNKVESQGGLTLSIPYIHGFETAINGAGSFSNTIRLNPMHGSSVLRIYSSIFNNTRTGQVSFDNSNTASSKLVYFTTSLNGTQLTDSRMTCSLNDDYLQFGKFLEGSVIQNPKMYKALGNTIIESYKAGPIWTHDDTVRGGMPLIKDEIYGLNVNVVGASVLYTFVVCQKSLNITGGSILVT